MSTILRIHVKSQDYGEFVAEVTYQPDSVCDGCSSPYQLEVTDARWGTFKGERSQNYSPVKAAALASMSRFLLGQHPFGGEGALKEDLARYLGTAGASALVQYLGRGGARSVLEQLQKVALEV